MLTPEQKAEIARRNGAKSKGPVTAEGKEKSRRNAITHGRRAGALRLIVPPHSAVLANEDRQAFYKLFDANTAKYRPCDQRELDLVRDITDLEWKIRRNAMIESAIYSRELLRQWPTIEESDPALADLQTTVAAAEALTGNKTIAELRRQTTHFRRDIRLIEARLKEMKKLYPSSSAVMPTTAADRAENLFTIEGAEESPAPATPEAEPERTQADSPQAADSQAESPKPLHIAGALTSHVESLYRTLFPDRALEFYCFEDPEQEAA